MRADPHPSKEKGRERGLLHKMPNPVNILFPWLEPEIGDMLLEFWTSGVAPIVALGCWRVHWSVFVIFHLLLVLTYHAFYYEDKGAAYFADRYLKEVFLVTMPIVPVHLAIGCYISVYVAWFYRVVTERFMLKVIPNMLVTLTMSFVVPYMVRSSKKGKQA
eukprot:Sspe_Gene.101013::Locus_75641_Transcript_1_1_Confidence_1.000_Length_880::g.101013::m.101013